jgi:predicted amidohydrolase
MTHDLVLAGGRVLDPETGVDRVCDVGIDGGSITAVGDELDGAMTVDVRGLVFAPGFINLHSHVQTLPGRRLQAYDGVTTALDLEAGRSPVGFDTRGRRSGALRSPVRSLTGAPADPAGVEDAAGGRHGR